MIKANVNFLGICFCLLVFTACRNGEDLPEPPSEVETVQLIVSVPASTTGVRAVGDPGTAVDEGADWNCLAVILAYTDDSKVQVTTISKDDFEKLPFYGNTSYRLLSIDAQLGKVYIYGVTYSVGEEPGKVLNNPDDDIKACKTRSEVEALTISNDYASTGTNTIDYAKFVSVATGYYQGDRTDHQPAEFTIQEGGTGQIGTIPTMTLTRLAAKIDIQWDAADAYDQGYTEVKVENFSYNGKENGRLFPDITGTTISNNDNKQWTFYNTSEISQRNGRVYHYTFPDGTIETDADGVSTPNVTFQITATDKSDTTTDKPYTLNFQSSLKQAAWYKVNATIRGITGAGNISLSMGNSGSQVGG